ncbi:MAG: hypothetical protein Q8L27_04100 [archaeon]|nr:hypothetical protein [archaeon]
MPIANNIYEEIAQAIENSKPFYAIEVQRFTEGLLEKDVAGVLGKEVIPEIVYLAETVKQHDDSDYYPNGPCLHLEKFAKYGSNFLRVLIEQIRKVDIHQASFNEAREYAASQGIILQ